MAKETRIDDKIGEKIQQLVAENPTLYLGWFALGVEIFTLAASIFNWNWIFKGNSYNLQKIEGISNMFGRNIARIYFWHRRNSMCHFRNNTHFDKLKIKYKQF